MTCWQSLGIFLVLALPLMVMLEASGGAAEKPVKYVRFRLGDTVAYGVVEGDMIKQIDGDLFGRWTLSPQTHRLADVELLVPTQTGKIIAAAGNYKSHLGDKPVPQHPELFLKPPSCLIATGQPIVLPRGSERVEAEGELVIVIGKRAKNVSAREAMSCILGVTCGNDVSARDWQKNDVQWWRAKGTDTFGPCGPLVVSGVNYNDLLLQTRINGQVVQQQRTADLIHDVAEMVSFASQHVTLEPGDLIYTGTPGKTSPLKLGDVVEVEIEEIGTLRNPVKAAE